MSADTAEPRTAAELKYVPGCADHQPATACIPGQEPTVLWLTGPSGAGKSTIAGVLAGELRGYGCAVAMVDGDDLRAGLCQDLGFSNADRDENVRRAAAVAELMAHAGLIVIVSLISPLRASRARARARFAPGEFFEAYVDTSLALAEQRDPKGLYRRARDGEIAQFTGIDSPYEPPLAPEITLATAARTPAQCARIALDALLLAGRLPGLERLLQQDGGSGRSRSRNDRVA
jgi:adenylyl-sulfate kinase